MNLAIPMNNDSSAGHFATADSFLVITANGDPVVRFANPALENSCCGGKKKLIAALQHYQVKSVLVRNIGQRMVVRLQAADISIHQLSSGRLPPVAMAREWLEHPKLLTDPQQARPPRKDHSNCSGCSGHH